jgi:hypothetical protein
MATCRHVDEYTSLLTGKDIQNMDRWYDRETKTHKHVYIYA